MVLNSVAARYSVRLSLCGVDHSAPSFAVRIMSKRSFSESFAASQPTNATRAAAAGVESDVAMHADLFPEMRDAVQQDLVTAGASRPAPALGPVRQTGDLGASRPMPMLQSPPFWMPPHWRRPDEASWFNTTDSFLRVRTDSVGMETAELDMRRIRSEESLDLEHRRYNDCRSVFWGDRHCDGDDPCWRERSQYLRRPLPQRRW